MKDDSKLLSRQLDVASITDGGTAVVVKATDDELRAIAKAYGFVEVRRLAADLKAKRSVADVVTVSGTLRAELVQACVVSLEPVDEEIDEWISTRFSPESSMIAGELVEGFGEGADADETFSGATVDVGRFVLDEFLLAVDPYPRAPGAVLPADMADTRVEELPFAALARLKRGRN